MQKGHSKTDGGGYPVVQDTGLTTACLFQHDHFNNTRTDTLQRNVLLPVIQRESLHVLVGFG